MAITGPILLFHSQFFAWAYSQAGKALLQKIEVVLGKALRIKE
jgi:hypothetical protein